MKWASFIAVSAEADLKCEVEMRRVTGLFSLLCQMADLRQLKMFDWSIKKKKTQKPERSYKNACKHSRMYNVQEWSYIVSGKWMRQKNYFYFKNLRNQGYFKYLQTLVTFCHSYQNKAYPTVLLFSAKWWWYEETKATLWKARKEVSSQCGVTSK